MGRLVISAGIAAALVVTAVALGAGSAVRIHRLHLPPPPAADELGGDQPAPPGTSSPADPGTSSPAPPSPPGAQPPTPPPTPSGVGCTIGGGATPSGSATLDDYTLSLTPTTFSSAGPLTFRGTNVGADFHAIAIKTPGAAGAELCGTPTILGGQSNTFTVTNLPAGSYVIYCTVHPDLMHEDITVN
jgi:hypothetical protein